MPCKPVGTAPGISGTAPANKYGHQSPEVTQHPAGLGPQSRGLKSGTAEGQVWHDPIGSARNICYFTAAGKEVKFIQPGGWIKATQPPFRVKWRISIRNDLEHLSGERERAHTDVSAQLSQTFPCCDQGRLPLASGSSCLEEHRLEGHLMHAK